MAEISSNQVRVVIVTPERSVLDEAASYAVLPLFDGEIGVYPGHAAFVGQLGPGELRIVSNSGTKHFYLTGGFAQVRANLVNILTPKAVPAAEVSLEKANIALAEADALPANDPVQRATRQAAQERARGMQRVAVKKR